MFGNWTEPFDLGAISPEEKERLRKDLDIKRTMSELVRKGRASAKKATCYYCGKETGSFCNSHSIPAFCLRNIATNGMVMTPNAMIDFPLLETEKGVNKAGTFQLICRECDSKIFADYENPDNYQAVPTPRMIAQIALKDALKSISKREFEIEFFNAGYEKIGTNEDFFQVKNEINEMDLNEYVADFRKARKAIEKDRSSEYYVCFFEKLDYVVPIAFQCGVALVADFEGNTINDIYNYDPNYEVKNIHICVFPLKSETVIIMFVDDGDKRYRRFIKQFKKLPLNEKLSTLTFILFAYSEDIFFSAAIKEEVQKNQRLCQASRTSTDMLSSTFACNPIEVLKESYNLNRRKEVPNLLDERYKLR